MRRPDDLHDFASPPLNEVAVGIQFAPVPAYSSVDSRAVWDLFREDFPIVQEHPLLSPEFETFGGTNAPPSFQFQVGRPPVGSRLWFVSQNQSHLIQFQRDRFIANWRKTADHDSYPRFEMIADGFERNLSILSEHFLAVFDYKFDINQAEISYVNLIPVEEFGEAGKWLNLLNSGSLDMEAVNSNFTQIIRDQEGRPCARFRHEIQSVLSVVGRHRAIQLSLTVKGKPATNDIPSALEFIQDGREKIVKRFQDISTSEAHAIWGRVS